MIVFAFSSALFLAGAQDAGSTPDPSLETLKFLVGTWTGQGKLANGEEYADEHRFEWIHNGHFLRAEYVSMSGAKVLQTATSIIGYDPEKKRLVAFVVGANGAIARSECVKSGKGSWIFEGRVVAAGVALEERITQARVDDDTFSVTIEMKRDAEFKEVGRHVYKRKK